MFLNWLASSAILIYICIYALKLLVCKCFRLSWKRMRIRYSLDQQTPKSKFKVKTFERARAAESEEEREGKNYSNLRNVLCYKRKRISLLLFKCFSLHWICVCVCVVHNVHIKIYKHKKPSIPDRKRWYYGTTNTKYTHTHTPEKELCMCELNRWQAHLTSKMIMYSKNRVTFSLQRANNIHIQ